MPEKKDRLYVRFDLTKQDINKAKKLLKDSSNDVNVSCPLALAIKRTLGKGVECVDVGSATLTVKYKSGSYFYGKLTKILQKKVSAFDKDKSIRPERHVLLVNKWY